MADQYKQLAGEIYKTVGGKSNIESFFNCMTRLRIKVIDEEKVHIDALKQIEGVAGVVQEDTLQIIIGPGKVNHVREELEKIYQNDGEEDEEDIDIKEISKQNKENFRKKHKNPLQQFIRRLANIFVPIIPALVACGLINGISKAIPQILNTTLEIDFTQSTFILILQAIGSVLFTYLAILVGLNTAKEFGGTPVLGAIAGGLIINPAIADISVFGEKLVPGNGGIVSVLLSVALMSYIEKQIRKKVPASLDIIVTPTTTLFITGLLTYFVFMPVGGFIAKGITQLLMGLLDVGGIAAGFILGATFLPLLATGLHQGFFPFHLELINQTGNDPLFTIQAMGGAGQVGAALAILVKTRKKTLKRAILGALPVGFLGIGEPLLYGVTLPLGRPFLTACLGAGVGGAVIAYFQVASLSIGVAGLSLFPLIDGGLNGMFGYAAGILTAYGCGFLFTYFFGFKETMAGQFK